MRLKTVRNILLFASTGVICQANAEVLDVRDAIQQTLTTNPQVLTQLREVDARGRQVREALGGFYPRVDLLAGFGFQERDPSLQTFSNFPTRTRNELERSEAQLNVNQLVFDGFNTLNEYRNQQARTESAEHLANAIGEDVSLQVVRVYLEVLKQQGILDLARETLATHEDIFDKMQKRFDSGVGSRADLDQISGRLALARTNVINSVANLNDAKTNFQRVVGRFPAEGELTSPGSYRKYLPGTVDDAVLKASDSHPVLKSARVDVEAVNYQYEQTKSSFYPRFNVEVERDLNKNIDGREGQIDDLQVMLRMRYNLYNGNSDQAKKQQFAYLVEKAKEIRNNAQREVEQEVRLSWVAYHALKDQLPSLMAHVRDSEETKKAYLQQFDLGRRTLLDLLNTENEMIEAKKSLVSAQKDLLYHEYRIFHAMGELMYIVGAKLESSMHQG